MVNAHRLFIRWRLWVGDLLWDLKYRAYCRGLIDEPTGICTECGAEGKVGYDRICDECFLALMLDG
jgi:hypothetical protein